MRIGILEPDCFSPDAISRLRAVGNVVSWDGHDLAGFLKDVEVLFIRLGHKIDSTFLSCAPALRYLCSPTTGLTHIDVNALALRNIRLISLRGETDFLDTIRATPEHTLGLALSLIRNYRGAFLNVGNPHWDRDRYRGEELYNMDVGLVGYGRIGRRIAHYLRAMEARVHWYDPYTNRCAEAGRCDSLTDLIQRCRMIILAASTGLSSPPIIDAETIQLMQDRWFINTARGELVDEKALLQATEAGLLRGVAVDVISNETGPNLLPQWLTLAERQNVIITPHIGGATFHSMCATEDFITMKLLAAVGGGT